jgi:hypothetical protein
MRHGSAWFRQAAIATTMLAAPLSPGVSPAVEIGVDAGLNVSSPFNRTNIQFAFPAYDASRSRTRQFVRIGLPVGSTGTLELTPGVEVLHEQLQFSGRRITSEALAVGVHYLGGRTAGSEAAPYFRVGAQGKFYHSSVPDSFFSSHTETQFGLSGGGGVRWRLGKVIGVRTEVVATRWLDGDYFGYWDYSLRGGVSAFTK